MKHIIETRHAVMAALLGGAIALAVAGCAPAGDVGSTPTVPDVDSLGLPTTSTASCDVGDKSMVYVSVLRENPVLQAMAQGAIDGANAAGFGSAEWVAAQGFDEPGSANLGNQAIAEGVDGIVVFATSPAFYPMIAKAAEAGIPVIQAHSQIPEGDAEGVLANFYPDPVAYGEAAARALGDKLAEDGVVGSIAITQSALIPNENAASTAFANVIETEYPDLTTLEPQAVGGDPTKAIAQQTSIAQANSDLVGAFDTSGNGPLTWSTTQRDTGTAIVIISMDYTKANLDLVADGEVYAIVAQPLYEEHYLSSMALAEALCGDPLEYDNPLEAPIVRADGLQQYYDLLAKVNIK